MRAFRLSKGDTEHYTSFEELRAAWGLSPVVKQTKDKAKLEKQRENFCNRHLCPSCKQPMVYSDVGNQMVCRNEKCLGIKHEQKNPETGETKIWYLPTFDLLDDLASTIAQNIFMEI